MVKAGTLISESSEPALMTDLPVSE
jgi:hypothetical protein